MTWEAPDLNEAELREIQRIERGLKELWKAPNKRTAEEIENLTPEQAVTVRIHVRRMLVMQLLSQEYHMHELDDCGDYLAAATDNWASLFANLWNDDFQDEVAETKAFLTDLEKYPVGGCDGEARIDLVVNFDGMEDE